MKLTAQELVESLSSKQAAQKLGVHPVTIRRRFANYPGVLNIGTGKNKILRIPKPVLQRFLLENDVVNERRVSRKGAR